jgi:hypothetical protein
MAIEREPNRYAALDEAQRKSAEREVTRRAEEVQQSDANVRAGRYASLNETQRRVDDEEMRRSARPEPNATEPERMPFNESDEVEARIAAKEKELEEKVTLKKITRADMVHEMRQFDSELRIEMDLRHERQGREEPASATQHKDRQRDDPSQFGSETSVEKEPLAPERDSTNRGEMSEARAARLERLRGTDRSLEQDRSERDGNGSEPTRDSGGRSR